MWYLLQDKNILEWKDPPAMPSSLFTGSVGLGCPRAHEGADPQ